MTRRVRFVGGAILGVLALLGLVWVVLASAGGKRSGSAAVPSRTVVAGAGLAGRLRQADAATGAGLFASSCAACHSVGRYGPDLDGPNLYGVVGGPVAGRRPRYGYTSALRNLGGRWSLERLDAWLTSPKGLVPGTSMPFDGLPDAQERADLIAFLNQQGSNLPMP